MHQRCLAGHICLTVIGMLLTKMPLEPTQSLGNVGMGAQIVAKGELAFELDAGYLADIEVVSAQP